MIPLLPFSIWMELDGMWEQGREEKRAKEWSVAITGSTVSSDPRFAGYSHLMLHYHLNHSFWLIDFQIRSV